MRSIFRCKIVVPAIFFFLGGHLVYSQEPKSYFVENEFDVSIPAEGKWSMEVGLGNRGLLQERSVGKRMSGYQQEHLELNHFTNYQTNESLVLSLGLRYRFRELFDDAKTDEFRFIEQIELEPVNSFLSHRFRLEQRFRENTIHRIRYKIGSAIPINQNFSVGVATEALYAVSTQLKPEAEQRFGLGLENSTFQDLKLELGFEYRIADYTQDKGHEFFVVSGLSFDL